MDSRGLKCDSTRAGGSVLSHSHTAFPIPCRTGLINKTRVYDAVIRQGSPRTTPMTRMHMLGMSSTATWLSGVNPVHPKIGASITQRHPQKEGTHSRGLVRLFHWPGSYGVWLWALNPSLKFLSHGCHQTRHSAPARLLSSPAATPLPLLASQSQFDRHQRRPRDHHEKCISRWLAGMP